MNTNLTQSQLKDLLRYDPISGDFIWISKNPNARRIQIGDVAGRQLKNGYIQIGIQGKYYLAHRLAFLYMLGEFPKLLVDHINGNPQDNKWENLRQVSPTQNSQNAAKSRKNTSGVTGVTWNTGVEKWVASIWANNRFIHLGCFDDLGEAATARRHAENSFGFHPNHGRSK